MAESALSRLGVQQTVVVSLREKGRGNSHLLHPSPKPEVRAQEQPMARARKGIKGTRLKQKSQLGHGRGDLELTLFKRKA